MVKYSFQDGPEASIDVTLDSSKSSKDSKSSNSKSTSSDSFHGGLETSDVPFNVILGQQQQQQRFEVSDSPDGVAIDGKKKWRRRWILMGLLIFIIAIIAITIPILYKKKEVPCLDSYHGIEMMYASDTAKCQNDWVSSWTSVRHLENAMEVDPDDTRCMQRGSGTISIGSDICVMKERTRYYVYKSQDVGYEDVEFTAYGKYVSDGEILSSSGLTMVARTNHGDFDDGCTAPGYMARLYRETGEVSLQKEYFHNRSYSVYSKSNRTTTPLLGDSLPLDQWIGMKFVVYTIPNETASVKLELYLDMNQGVDGGDWVLVHQVIDTPGSWNKTTSSQEIPTHCEVQDGDTVLGSRDVCFLRMDGNDESEVHWANASIRHILPMKA
jgi:hypothetical protein